LLFVYFNLWNGTFLTVGPAFIFFLCLFLQAPQQKGK